MEARDADAVMAWLNDDTDVWVPPHVAHVTEATSPNGVPDSDDTTAEGESPLLPAAVASSSALCDLEHSETVARSATTAEYSDSTAALLFASLQELRVAASTPRWEAPPGGAVLSRDEHVYQTNRRLITTDLVKDLYDSNKQLREELQQVMGVFSMLQQQRGKK